MGVQKRGTPCHISRWDAPVLSASVADNIPLSYTSQDNDGVQLSWTNPNYQFNTGISSLNVNYTIEIDTAGANFTNPNREVLSLGTDLSKDFTQSAFNDYLLNQLQLKPAVSHNIELRVRVLQLVVQSHWYLMF